MLPIFWLSWWSSWWSSWWASWAWLLAAVTPLPDALIGPRADEHLGAVEAALGQGDAPAAARALALASVYVDTRLFEAAWEPGARAAARERVATLGRRVAALRVVDERLPLLAAAESARAVADAQRPRRATDYAAAAEAARACAAPPREGVDASWASPRGSVDDVIGRCRALADETAAAEGRVAAETAERQRSFRAILHGDRLAIYEKHGEPTDPLDPEAAARAITWTYISGPSGPLRTVITTTLTFRGDKLVGRRRVQRHAR